MAAALCLNGKSGGTEAQILSALQWAIQKNVDVISTSLGGLTLGPDVPPTYTVTIRNALRVGMPVVSAIGNSGNQTSGSPGNDFFSFAIGATDVNDMPAGFSCGRTHVVRDSRFIPAGLLPFPYSKPDISAPGVAICSSIPGGKWEAFNGTSMATPHVAGAIALLLSATSIRDKIDAANRAYLLLDLVTSSVEELGEAGQDHRFGFGRLDVLRALAMAWIAAAEIPYPPRHEGCRRHGQQGAEDPRCRSVIQLDELTSPATIAQSSFASGRPRLVFGDQLDGSARARFAQFGEFLEQAGARKTHPIELANAYSATLPANALTRVASHPLVVGIDDQSSPQVVFKPENSCRL